MKKRYITFLALIGIFCFQFFLVERTEYIAGENRYYTFYEKYLDNEIDISSSSAYDNDFYNLERITSKIAYDYNEAENIRQHLKKLYEEIFSDESTYEYFNGSIGKLNEYSEEIKTITNDLRVQKNYLKELGNYIKTNENQTKSIYFYLSDIEGYLNRAKSVDTILNNYSHFISDLTSIVETSIEKTRQEQERRQRQERIIEEQRLRNSFAKTNKNSNQSINSFNSNYTSSFQNSSSNSRTSSTVKYYTNTNGNRIQSPTYYNTQPSGASALCKDGTYSFSRNRRGTCSGHGGVRKWL